jgi:hypothetical protein
MEKVKEFLSFNSMITPSIIKALFRIGVGICLLAGVIGIINGVRANYGGGMQVIYALLIIVFGPIIVRIYCELLIVIFKINDTLTDIKTLLKDKQ